MPRRAILPNPERMTGKIVVPMMSIKKITEIETAMIAIIVIVIDQMMIYTTVVAIVHHRIVIGTIAVRPMGTILRRCVMGTGTIQETSDLDHHHQHTVHTITVFMIVVDIRHHHLISSILHTLPRIPTEVGACIEIVYRGVAMMLIPLVDSVVLPLVRIIQ